MAALLGDSKLLKQNELVSSDCLNGKFVAFYFSASWCPPCQGFTPQLGETYKSIVASGQEFEIIFVSSDRSEDEFKQYYQKMPFAALPFENRAKKDELSEHFGVEGIPTLVILRPDGSVITKEGRACVLKDKGGSDFPWEKNSRCTIL
jgi:nucleoredoxin